MHSPPFHVAAVFTLMLFSGCAGTGQRAVDARGDYPDACPVHGSHCER